MVIVVFVGAGMLALSILSVVLGHDRRLKRSAAKLPLTPLREAVEGRRVKVSGVIDPESARLKAPISGRACAAWLVDLEQGSNNGWEEVLTEWRSDDFVIVDDGVNARIEVADADLVYERDADAVSGWGQPTPMALREFLRKHGQKEASFFGDTQPWRSREGALEAGERVVIVGTARREVDPSPRAIGGAYREPPTRLVFSASARSPLWILDGPARWRIG
jgi:hypothetical protein